MLFIILSKFQETNELLLPLKSSKNHIYAPNIKQNIFSGRLFGLCTYLIGPGHLFKKSKNKNSKKTSSN